MGRFEAALVCLASHHLAFRLIREGEDDLRQTYPDHH
jgi:hypothetical protein